MRNLSRTVICLLALVSAASGQRVSVGVVGGAPITANFPVTERSGPADEFNPAYRFQYASGPRSFIFGALLEGRLSDSFSIEANVLHRPLKTTIRYTEFHADGSTAFAENTFTAVRTWQFPVLLKYTLPASRFSGSWRPFLAVGPSFRTQEEATATEPSRLGFTAGVGAAIRLGRFRLAPALRYTRWASEDISPRYSTKPDQLELLASFAYESDTPTWRVGKRRIEIGALAGLAATDQFESLDGDRSSERLGYLVGLTAEASLNDKWAVEMDAIYKPLQARNQLTEDFVVLTWQFPVLAKYRWAERRWTPFVAAGPSFRLAGNLNASDPSHLGATVGAGVETQAGGARFAPAVRYTRWAADSPSYEPTNQNAVEVVFGVSF